jgi:hypothetical protein
MKIPFTKITLVAAFALAFSFTFNACGEQDGGGGTNELCGGASYDIDIYSCEMGELIGKCRGVDYYAAYEQCVNGAVVSISSSSGNGSSGSGSSDNGNGKEVISTMSATHIVYNANGEVASTSTYKSEYDSKGNQTKIIYYNADGNITTGRIEYEYDSRGNATKMTQYSQQTDTGNYIVVLEVTYIITYTRL